MIRGIVVVKHTDVHHSGHESNVKAVAKNSDPCDNESNPDWEYMKHCHEVDENRPETWKAYAKNIVGANDIIKMEYDELMKCAKIGDMKGWEENIYHLSVALLNAWRLYKHDGK